MAYELLSVDEGFEPMCCVPLEDGQIPRVLNETNRPVQALARITPYLWAFIFYNVLLIVGGTFVYLIFVFNETTCSHGKQLPDVHPWVSFCFLPILVASTYLDIRASQRILPCFRKFKVELSIFSVPAPPWLWMVFMLIQGMASRFELATSAIIFSRLWQSTGCPDNAVEKVWAEVRSKAEVYLPNLWVIGFIAFATSWLPVIFTAILALPSPDSGRNWVEETEDFPAMKPISFHDLVCTYVNHPKPDGTGGFFSISGARVYVMSSLNHLARASNSYVVAVPLDQLNQAIENDRLAQHSGTRHTSATAILFDGLLTIKLTFGIATWLNIKCTLVGINGHLDGSHDPDTMLLLAIFMSTGSFFMAILLATTSLQKKFRALYPHINERYQGKWRESRQAYERDLSGEILFEETDWDVTVNKAKAYTGLGCHIFFGITSVYMVLYALVKLYKEIFKCHVRPWNWDDCVYHD